jgi:hypothetical protein
MTQQRQEYKIPLEHLIPEDLELKFVNNITVQQTDHEFLVGFYQVRPPLILGTLEERRAKAEQIGPVRAKCVAYIAMPPGRLKEFIAVLQDNLDKYLAGSQKEGENE